eukprot:7183146-Prorocentrum_lima.AAC.1
MCIRDRKKKVTEPKNNSNIQEEHGLEHNLSSILGALRWIGFRTRPYIYWAVTRVSRAAKTGESEHDMQENARMPIKHILQYLAMTWN